MSRSDQGLFWRFMMDLLYKIFQKIDLTIYKNMYSIQRIRHRTLQSIFFCQIVDERSEANSLYPPFYMNMEAFQNSLISTNLDL